MKKAGKVVVSGFFDPIHIGHIEHLREAKSLGEKLIVILARDDQCVMKKGYYFMPFETRKAILESLRFVDEVVQSIDQDTLCVKTLEMLKPDIFAKGGDRTPDNMPEAELETCRRLNIKIVYNVGGKKRDSSSSLIERIRTLGTKNKASP